MEVRVTPEPKFNDIIKMIERQKSSDKFSFIFNNKTVQVPMQISDLISPKIFSVHKGDPLYREMKLDIDDSDESIIDILVKRMKGEISKLSDLTELFFVCHELGCEDVVDDFLPSISSNTINDRVEMKLKNKLTLTKEVEFISSKSCDLSETRKALILSTIESAPEKKPEKEKHEIFSVTRKVGNSSNLLQELIDNGMRNRIHIKATNSMEGFPVENLLTYTTKRFWQSGPNKSVVCIQIDFDDISIDMSDFVVYTSKINANPTDVSARVFMKNTEKDSLYPYVWSREVKCAPLIDTKLIPCVYVQCSFNDVKSICISLSGSTVNISLNQIVLFGTLHAFKSD